jgi:hypothetical protein
LLRDEEAAGSSGHPDQKFYQVRGGFGNLANTVTVKYSALPWVIGWLKLPAEMVAMTT